MRDRARFPERLQDCRPAASSSPAWRSSAGARIVLWRRPPPFAAPQHLRHRQRYRCSTSRHPPRRRQSHRRHRHRAWRSPHRPAGPVPGGCDAAGPGHRGAARLAGGASSLTHLGRPAGTVLRHCSPALPTASCRPPDCCSSPSLATPHHHPRGGGPRDPERTIPEPALLRSERAPRRLRNWGARLHARGDGPASPPGRRPGDQERTDQRRQQPVCGRQRRGVRQQPRENLEDSRCDRPDV